MRQFGLLIALCSLLGGLTACSGGGLFRNAAHEQAFRERFMMNQRPWYTAITLRPYTHAEGYLIDLTGTIAEDQYDTYRAATTIPLGSRIRLTRVDKHALTAQIEGYRKNFQILVSTQQGTSDDVAKELDILLSAEPPLPAVRAAMRNFVARQQIARGMSWREVLMSWGQPDKTQVLPSSASTLEEWIYFDKGMHLYMENGSVTNWQQM